MTAQQEKRWEVGKVLAGVITLAIAALLQLGLTFMAYQNGLENKVAIQEVAKTSDETQVIANTTEKIVNSQRTAMTKKIDDQGLVMEDLKAQIVALQRNLDQALRKPPPQQEPKKE